jgi:signal transduction histidine kinase
VPTNSGKPDLPDGISPQGRRFSIRSLRWRILFWMTVVALGPLIIMAYQGYYCGREAIVESEHNDIRAALDARKARLEGWLDELKSDFRFMVTDAAIRFAFSEAAAKKEDGAMLSSAECNCPPASAVLEELRRERPSYESLVYYDLHWVPISEAHAKDCTASLTLPPRFQTRLSTARGVVLSTLYQERDDSPGIRLGEPYLDSRGVKTGYVVACLDLGKVLDQLLSYSADLGHTGRVFLISRDGRYLHAQAKFKDLEGTRADLPPEFFAAGTSALQEYEDEEGKKMVGASSPVPALGASLLVAVDSREAFRWLGILKGRALMTGVITFVLITLLALELAGHIARPLRELVRVTTRIAHGRHEERLCRFKVTEAQELCNAFNQMLDELQESQRRLSHAAALASVGELSSSIVHEMRNPLSSIKLNLQALRMRVREDPTYAELAELAQSQVLRLERMLSDLLGYGKPLRMHFTNVCFRDLVKDVIEVVRQETAEKGVSFDVEDGLGDRAILVDPEQIRRALTNLALNAVQASPPAGKVHIASGLIPGSPARASIAVSDEGAGIPPSQKDRLFAPFFTTREGGTGLGLANAKKIVDYHGGTISAENRPGGGATFTIVLPLARITE